MALDREQVGLLFKVRADSSEAQRTLTQLRGTIGNTVTDIRGRFDGLANNISGFTSSLSGGFEGLAAGLTGVAGLAAGAAAALGALSIQTANFAGEIADLSAKTNLSTDTLQSLKLAATLSGQSFQAVSETAVIFQRRMEEARAGNEQLKRTFDALQINLNGPVDQAFRQTLERLAGVEDGAQKTSAAVDLFGRSGANLLPIMGQLGGSFQDLENRARELGIILDEEAIKKADEFGDQIDLLKLQLGGLANDIGSVVIPAFSGFIQSISATIAIFRKLSESTESSILKIQRLAFIIKSFSNIATIPQGVAGILGAPGFLDKPPASKEEVPDVTLPRGGGKTGSGRAAKPETVRLPIRDFSNIVDQYFKQLGKLEEEQLRRLEQVRERSARVMEQILQEQQEREIDAIRAQVDQRIITEEDGAARIAAVRVAAFARIEDELVRRLGELDEEVTRANTEAAARPFDGILQRRAEALQAERDLVKQQLTLIEEERTSITEAGNQAIEAARERDLQNLLDYANEQKRIYQDLALARQEAERFDPLSARSIFGDAFADSLRRTGSELQAFRALFSDFVVQMRQESADLGSLADTALNSFTQGLSAMVEQLILTGSTGPAALRQLTAAVLLNVAKMAAVKAIFALAEGFINLALFNFPAAAAAFKAAALYGAVAVAAGVAGGAIAPSSGASGGFVQQGRESRDDRRVIDQGGPRRGQEPQIVIIRAEVGEGVIVRQIEKDYRANGSTRQMLRRDILGEGG